MYIKILTLSLVFLSSYTLLNAQCASTCAASAASSCNVSVTAIDMNPTSYTAIVDGGGENCFVPPVDVSTGQMTVTTCFDYLHNTPASNEFLVLVGTSVVENNNTNGVIECASGVSSVEVFDASCNSLLVGGQGATYSSAMMGTTYVICVTGFANNGTAEGDCVFDCIANSVTPTSFVLPPCDADTGTWDNP